MTNTIVIVGAGQAGFQTAASLRSEGFDGEIVLIGDEDGLPYQRPPLSKAYLLGKVQKDELAFRSADFFDTQNITRVQGTVTAIDAVAKEVYLASEQKFDYDHLVLATGARNRPLSCEGVQFDGVYSIKTLGDADQLLKQFDRVQNVVVIGAGFIGLEFAAVANDAGKNVDVLELAPLPMGRALSTEMSEFFSKSHAASGIVLRFGDSCTEVLGEAGQVTGVKLASGEVLKADIVVYGIGVVPNDDLAAAAGLDIENGVLVDENLLTSDPAISAIGDCAAFPCAFASGNRRLESVQNAADQARCVAARLAGKPKAYGAVPWFWSDQGDLKLQIVGISERYDRAIQLGDPEAKSFSLLLFAGKDLIAVESVNRPGDFMAARKLLASTPRLTPEQASEADFDLRGWMMANK